MMFIASELKCCNRRDVISKRDPQTSRNRRLDEALSRRVRKPYILFRLYR